MKLVLFCVAFALLMPVVVIAQPVASFSELHYDFGAVQGVDRVEHFFEFTNTGDQDLVIEKVTPS